MNQAEKARAFAALHRKGQPLLLYNVWDAGTAKAVADAGAKAIATGSWSVAAAHGYPDGEAIPLDLALRIVARIAATVDLPLTVDFEGGYAVEPERLAANADRLLATGAIGVNFEDRVVGGSGLHPVDLQTRRIAALRRAADERGVPLFVNARTDLFLGEPDASRHAALMDEAMERAAAYAEAGADGFFVPALVEESLIARVTEASRLPVNVMMRPGLPPLDRLGRLGVARVSWGPAPYREAMERIRAAAVV
ncbi:MAG: isocitrate lyase/phosphoenolpyruvate mutase family protein [Alphaproteobacteria bacterium]